MRQDPDEFARQVRRFGPLIAIVIFAVMVAHALINWPGNPTMLAVGVGAGLFSVALFAWGSDGGRRTTAGCGTKSRRARRASGRREQRIHDPLVG